MISYNLTSVRRKGKVELPCWTPSRVVCKEEAFQRGAIEMIIQA
jgi:hypothetical protein